VLEASAAQIRERTGVEVRTVAADITTPEGRARVLAAAPQIDILINNAGGPPPGNFRNWTREHWIAALEANMLTPIELIKATVDGMIERGFGRIVNITSSSVKAPIEVLGLSNGARSGLTGFVAGIARQTVRHNVTINNLLPGVFDTDRIRATAQAMAAREGQSLEETLAARAQSIPAGRLGEPWEFGQACAWLCSAQASFVTGQNLLIDGGAYPGTY
jgi:3-oxoacyl-[acyl-carrier protein] reductase